MIMKKIYLYSSITLLMLSAFSCKKLVEADSPPTQLTPDKVFSDSSSVVAATVNMYTVLNTVDANFINPVGSYTDELISSTTDATSIEFNNSALTVNNSRALSIWQNLYSTIYKANALIEGLSGTSNIPARTKNQGLGEAKFLRAYSHFMLCNIFGDVPSITTTNAAENSNASRTPYSDVMKQVIADLIDAQALLPSAYPGSGDKVRANKWAANFLLAKAYLYTGDFAQAETTASLVINSGQYTLMTDLNKIFLANSSEAIWQIWNTSGYSGINTVPTSGKPSYQVSPRLLSAFETGDQRRTKWVGSIVVNGTTYYYPYKYKLRTPSTGSTVEYTMSLRLAEMYLIRAEARAQENKLTDAVSDINVIRTRAGLTSESVTDQISLMSAILHERQVELFQETGNRFFDLRRSGTINSVLAAVKPLWKPTGSVFPIPQSERLKDPNLSQNPGYNN